MVRRRFFPSDASYERVMRPLGRLLTLLVVVTSLVFFRSDDVPSAIGVLKGMFGLNGLAPTYMQILLKYDPQANWAYILLHYNWYPCCCIAAMLLVTTWAPNSLELLRSLRPALDFPADGTTTARPSPDMEERWTNRGVLANIAAARAGDIRLTIVAALMFAAFLVLGLSAIERSGTFIYGQF